MPLFKRLVEREILEDDHHELHVFLRRVGDERAMIKDRQERIIDCYPFHEISRPKASTESEENLPYHRLNIERPLVGGFAKLKHVCTFYKYTATPQFLD